MRVPCVVILAVTALMVSTVHSEGSLNPWLIPVHPVFLPGTPPSWTAGNTNLPLLNQESDFLEIPVPPLASQDEIGCFALTTVFEDNGDGGPVVEWISNEGGLTLLSAGLGETGVALGFNSRTLLLPQTLTLDGGRLRISFPGRFPRLLSTSLTPARELGVAALDGLESPALITGTGSVLSAEDVSGDDVVPPQGDREEGRVVHADLAAGSLRIDVPGGEPTTEFVIPISANPSGSQLVADVGGLDPESWIEVSLNGESRGVLAPEAASLAAQGALLSRSGRLQIPGWRKSSLLLPARLWKSGENSAAPRRGRRGSPRLSQGRWLRLALSAIPIPCDDSSAPGFPPSQAARSGETR